MNKLKDYYFMKKQRVIYLCFTLFCIFLGLASRHYGIYLPSFVIEYAGDAIWAAMVYYGFRFLTPHSGIGKAALWAWIFSWCIEFSQLYQAEWIRQLRANRFAALILGQGFLWSDLICYVVGIIIALLLDRWIITKLMDKISNFTAKIFRH